MTTTLQPPSISQQPGTPAHEWAQDTVGAVDGAAETTRQTEGNQVSHSNVTTPGNELPGAFPRTASTTGTPTTTTLSETAQSALGSVKNTAASAQQQVAPVAQSASQTASGVLASAEQAARQYLPASVVGTLEGAGVLTSNGKSPTHTTLPSQETGSEPTTSGGVGSLPGTASEADVAKLPEERALERDIGAAVGREGAHGTSADKTPSNTAHVSAVGGDAQRVTENTGIPGAPSTAGAHTASQFLDSSLKPVPAEEAGRTDLHHVTSPHSGTQHASDSHTSNTSPDKDAQAAERAEKKLPPPGGNTNTDVPGTGGNTAYASNQGKKEPARTSPNHAYTPPGTDTELGAGREHQNSVHYAQQTHERDSEGGSARTGGSGDSATGGKPSLSQKIKGEAKIIAGKMSKDAKKVEAGKAMKEGHA